VNIRKAVLKRLDCPDVASVMVMICPKREKNINESNVLSNLFPFLAKNKCMENKRRKRQLVLTNRFNNCISEAKIKLYPDTGSAQF
jgi:hypothetical protein